MSDLLTSSSAFEQKSLKRRLSETFSTAAAANDDMNNDRHSISPNSIGHDHQHRRFSPNNIAGGRQSISPPLSNGTSTTMPHDIGSPGRSLSPLSLVTNHNQSLITNTQQSANSLTNMAQFLAAAHNNRQSLLTGSTTGLIIPSVSTPPPSSTTPSHHSSSSAMSPGRSSLPVSSAASTTSSSSSTTTMTTQQPQISAIGHPNHPMMVAAAAAAAAAAHSQLPSSATGATTASSPQTALPSDYQHAAAFYPWFLRANPFAGRFPGKFFSLTFRDV